ncbi:MAG TPA: hypothetical protein VLY63_05625 [Anaerolineae bacterium]|nr:hypothetical protein [Anaerolineae bacterium]
MLDSLECDGVEVYELGKELMSLGASLQLEVRGWSMYPFLKDKDVVEIAPVRMAEIDIGDIVVFRSEDRLLAHRVVGVVSDEKGFCLRVRGDSFRQEDPPVKETNLIGKITAVHRDRRTGQHVIRLDQGSARSLGRWVAQSRFVHRCVRRGAIGIRRLRSLVQRFTESDRNAWNRSESNVEEYGGNEGTGDR